jgi:hypothetical protein
MLGVQIHETSPNNYPGHPPQLNSVVNAIQRIEGWQAGNTTARIGRP